MASREINIGKIVGESAYELAIRTGAFQGTLAEYVNKEQEYYNQMVAYGDQLKLDVEAITNPAYNMLFGSSDPVEVASGTATELYYNEFGVSCYASITGFVEFTEAVSGTLRIYINGTSTYAAPMVNGIANISCNAIISANDDISIKLYHEYGSAITTQNLNFNILIFERS